MMGVAVHVHEERRGPDPVFRVWDRARAEALERDSLPVAALRGHEWYGRLLIVHENDLRAVADALEGRGR